jgi:hypothetical protein
VRHERLLATVARRVQDRDTLPLRKLILKAAGKRGVPQGGERTPPTILQTFFGRAGIARTWRDPEPHLHLVLSHLHPLDQRADHLPLPVPLGLCQPGLHLCRKVLQAPADQLQVGRQGRCIGKLVAQGFQVGDPLAEPGDPGCALLLFNEPLGVTIDQPCQALPPLAARRLERGEGRALGVPVGLPPPPVFLRQPLRVGPQRQDCPPPRQLQQIRPPLGILTDTLAATAVGVGSQAPVIGVRAGSALAGPGAAAFPLEGIAAVLTL